MLCLARTWRRDSNVRLQTKGRKIIINTSLKGKVVLVTGGNNPYGITANIVSPGPIQTGYISEEIEEALIPDIPLRRVGQPEDIADAIVFFASEQARWITGQLLWVHGGHPMVLGR